MRGILVGAVAALAAQSIAPIAWGDLPSAIRQRLERSGLDGARFPAWVAESRARHAARVLEGDEDHMVFYALQSRRITEAPPIEPALSARALVASLDAETRARFLADPDTLPVDRIPHDARARLQALLRAALEAPPGARRQTNAVERPADDRRLGYFREMLRADPSDGRVARAYARAMRFLAEQARAAAGRDAAGAIAALYRTRGLSTDTSVAAGYLVHEGLATLRALEPTRRIRRVVIVGPGLDLAPRTGFQEAIPPQSVQPFAVADALLALGLSDPASLRITCLDINPRVVDAITRTHAGPVLLTLSSGLDASARVTLSDEFRRYVETLGAAIGAENGRGNGGARRISVTPAASRTIEARTLDIVLDRAPLAADLVVVTNVLAYFDDRELTLALANIAALLASGGVLVHNEARPEVGEITAALGLPLAQARTATIATAAGAPPYYDSVFVHRKD